MHWLALWAVRSDDLDSTPGRFHSLSLEKSQRLRGVKLTTLNHYMMVSLIWPILCPIYGETETAQARIQMLSEAFGPGPCLMGPDHKPEYISK
jgi:hypothetical protein